MNFSQNIILKTAKEYMDYSNVTFTQDSYVSPFEDFSEEYVYILREEAFDTGEVIVSVLADTQETVDVIVEYIVTRMAMTPAERLGRRG